jgi:hypothetical protein
VKAAVQRAASTAATEGVLILVVGLFAIIVVSNLAPYFTTDTWLALVSGREIAHGGLPHTDTLTVWSAGDHWVDQQWLGQLALYGLRAVGGFGLMAISHALLVIAPFAAALAIARRRGAGVRGTLAIGLLAIEPCLIVGANIRAQTFAFGLFVIVLWLLSGHQRAPSKRVFWTIPVLVLWSNIHGSVVLGGALVVLAGSLSVFQVLRGRRAPSGPSAQQSLLLVALAVAALFASPYAASLPSYYGATLFNPQFRVLVAEWLPPEASLLLAPFFLLIGTAVAVLGRAGPRLTSFERAAIAGTIVLALTAYRNLAWFALVGAMFLPPAMGSGPARDARPPRLVAVGSGVVVTGVVIFAIASLAGLDDKLRERFAPRMFDTVAAAAARDPTLQIYADLTYADWLLWNRPELAGHVLFDARLELLSDSELRRILRFQSQTGADWRPAAGAARLFVLPARERPLEGLPTTASVLLRSSGARKLYADAEAVVVLDRNPG